MERARGPAECDIDRAEGNKLSAVVASAGDAELVRDLIDAREFFDLRNLAARSDVGIVHCANRETLADFGVAEAFRFERRIGTDQCIDREDVIGRMALGSEALGQRTRSDQAEFLAGGPDKRYVAIFQRSAERPNGGNERRVTAAIVEAAPAGARAEQRAIFLGNRD